MASTDCFLCGWSGPEEALGRHCAEAHLKWVIGRDPDRNGDWQYVTCWCGGTFTGPDATGWNVLDHLGGRGGAAAHYLETRLGLLPREKWLE